MKKYAIKSWTDDDCAKVQDAFELMQGKHTLLLVSILVLEGKKSFGELKRAIDGISTKILSQRLTMLVQSNVIKNERVMEGKVKKSYYYIDKGKKEFENILKAFKAYSTTP